MPQRKEEKWIFAIRNRVGYCGSTAIHTIGLLSRNFQLALGQALHRSSCQGVLIEQEKTKTGQYIFSFEVKGPVRIVIENVLVSFPICCIENDGHIVITEDDFKRFVMDLRTVLNAYDSDDSSCSKHSSSQQQISLDHRSRGRPRGSRNRRKQSHQKSSQQQFLDDSNIKYQEKRGRGRPKGAKNVKKNISEENEFNVLQLFTLLLQNKPIQEINTKIQRLKEKDGLLSVNKKDDIEADEYIKRSRGRPKGVKNKPKINNEDSQSEQTGQQATLPKRKLTKQFASDKCCSHCHNRQYNKSFLQSQSVDISQLKDIASNLGVEDRSNIIINAIKHQQENILRRLLLGKQFKDCSFAVCWDVSRLEDVGYTVRTKKEFLSKGKREGIYALIQDCRQDDAVWWRDIGVERILQSIPNSKSGINIYQILAKSDVGLAEQFLLNIVTIIRSGNEHLSAYLLDRILQEESNELIYGYSKQHLQCLGKKRNELQFRRIMLLRPNSTANFCSPIHCAVINSNIDLLGYILKHISEFNIGDSLNRKPVHYAAVLETPKALEMLLKYGADLRDIDKRKMTPLMLSAKYGRHKVIKYILDKVRDQQYINSKGEDGLAALHHAILSQHSESIQLLLQDPLVDREIETKEGMTIMHLAAGTGQRQIMRLVQDKQLCQQGDNYRKTALMLCIRNHHNDAFFQLFTHGSKYYKRDYSYNTLLHYAAAYGNVEIIKYFLDIGIGQTMNRKCIYPFELAVLKGHMMCAKMLENWDLHYIQHLPSMILKNPRGSKDFIEMCKYLVNSKRYDLNYRCHGGNTCLHLVCLVGEEEYYRNRSQEISNLQAARQKNQYGNMQKELIILLLEHGCDALINNDRGETAIALCIGNENMVGMRLLLKEIPFDLPPTRNNHFVYYLANLACLGHEEMDFVLQKLRAADEKILRTELHKTDYRGLQLLISVVKSFTETVHQNFKQNYLRQRKMLETEETTISQSELQRRALLKACRQYELHQKSLIDLTHFLVENGADTRFVISQPKLEDKFEDYRRWGIQHFLMRFPSLTLLKMFMRLIDTSFNRENSEGRTPLHLFCMWNHQGSLFNNYYSKHQLPMIDLSEMRQYEGKRCLEYLLENGLTTNIADISRSTPLLYAAINGQLIFVNLLRLYGSTINNVNSENRIPLLQILKLRGRFTLQQIQSLFGQNGAKPQFKDNNLHNALHHLVSNCANFDSAPEVCKKLIEHGVDINSVDKFGRSPIFYCFILIHMQPYSYYELLSVPSARGAENKQAELQDDRMEILSTLLQHPSIDISITDCFQRTILHYACQNKFFLATLLLLDKDLPHDEVDYEHNTPLAICLLHGNLPQAALLIKKGVKYGYVFEDNNKLPYFAYANQHRMLGICFLLLDHGYPLQCAMVETADELLKRLLNERYH